MVRPGKQVTVLTYSRMRHCVLSAAKTLVNKGYDPEIIDIRSLKPFDLYTIGNSVKKTRQVLIVEECMQTGGIGASLAAAIYKNFFYELDDATMCLSSKDVPTGYAGSLEEWTLVQEADIVTAVEDFCAELETKEKSPLDELRFGHPVTGLLGAKFETNEKSPLDGLRFGQPVTWLHGAKLETNEKSPLDGLRLANRW
ncbi:hypothetical protein Vadar_020606 [Vaccinium darrowii]|uniref:Uncharacterized protein n=1 Tax=Vaccinium darrowii TaxID=229202 RepID=A0ACB7YPC2_9ERIC|nr:hypothetical protein Vadar_020606 [Vaccinium darrowii]